MATTNKTTPTQNLGVSNVGQQSISPAMYRYVDPNKDLNDLSDGEKILAQTNANLGEQTIRSMIWAQRDAQASEINKVKGLIGKLPDGQPQWIVDLDKNNWKLNKDETFQPKFESQVPKTDIANQPEINNLSEAEKILAKTNANLGEQTVRNMIQAQRDRDAQMPVVQAQKPTPSSIFQMAVDGIDIPNELRSTKEFETAMRAKAIYDGINSSEDLSVALSRGLKEGSDVFKIIERTKPQIVAEYRRVKPIEEAKDRINESGNYIFKSYSDAMDNTYTGSADAKAKIEDLKKNYKKAIDSVPEPEDSNFAAKAQAFYQSEDYKAQLGKVNSLSTEIEQLKTERANLGKTEADRASASTPAAVVNARIYVKDSLLNEKINSLGIQLRAESGLLDSKVNDFKTTLAVEQEDMQNKAKAYDRKIATVKDIFSYDKYALDAEMADRKEERDRRFQLKLKDIDAENARATKAMDKSENEKLMDKKLMNDMAMEEFKLEKAKLGMADDAMVDSFANDVINGASVEDKAKQLASTNKSKVVSPAFYTYIKAKASELSRQYSEKYGKVKNGELAERLNYAVDTMHNQKAPSAAELKDLRNLIQLYGLQDITLDLYKGSNAKFDNKTLPTFKIGNQEFDPNNILANLKLNNANAVKAQFNTLLTAQFGSAKGLTGDSGQLSNQDMERIAGMLQDAKNPEDVNRAIAEMIKAFAVSTISNTIKADQGKNYSGIRDAYEEMLFNYYKKDIEAASPNAVKPASTDDKFKDAL